MHDQLSSLPFGDKRLPVRFWQKVSADLDSGCWNWRAAKSKGYGVFILDGDRCLAHRLIFKIAAHDPGELFVLHKCDNPACVNPAHLFVGDQSANMQDMAAKGRWKANHASLRKTHCANGHPLHGDNVRLDKHGHRICRACFAASYRKWKLNKRASDMTDIIDFQAGREAAIAGKKRDARRNADWLRGWDQVNDQRKGAENVE